MRPGLLALLLALGALVFGLLGLLHGAHGPTLATVFGGLDATDRSILFSVRLPSILMAVSAGAALAVSGALMQTYFRNPLAEPYVTGVSAGGALGAVAALGLGLSSLLVAPAALLGSALIT